MTTADIEAIRDELKEAARYCESDPETAKALIIPIRNEALWLQMCDDHIDLANRLWENLMVGWFDILVDPAVLQDYLYGAIHELGALRSQIEQDQGEK